MRNYSHKLELTFDYQKEMVNLSQVSLKSAFQISPITLKITKKKVLTTYIWFQKILFAIWKGKFSLGSAKYFDMRDLGKCRYFFKLKLN